MHESIHDHLAKVERYGFKRTVFPVEYSGHVIDIVMNDAHILEDDRLMFHFTLVCTSCGIEGSLSGRFPDGHENQIEDVVAAKVLVFGEFKENDCVSG